MKVLNLTNREISEIKYEIYRFPDGQQQVKLFGWEALNNDEWGKFLVNYPIQINSRLNDWKDLEIIVCAVASLRELGVDEIHLYTPYIVGARSDRKFEEGSNNYLKDVICPIINSLKLDSVTVLDPHSDCLEMGIKNFKKEDNYTLVDWAVADIMKQNGDINDFLNNGHVFVSPDAGASKKIYKISEKVAGSRDVITCSKDRDVNGKLTKTVVPKTDISKDIIIIDDICDGGATFINIVKEIKSFREAVKPIADINEVKYGKIYLVVTHGIFSKGFDELNKYFDGIYCTNSYGNINNTIVLDTPKGTEGTILKGFIKQLNVF